MYDYVYVCIVDRKKCHLYWYVSLPFSLPPNNRCLASPKMDALCELRLSNNNNKKKKIKSTAYIQNSNHSKIRCL